MHVEIYAISGFHEGRGRSAVAQGEPSFSSFAFHKEPPLLEIRFGNSAAEDRTLTARSARVRMTQQDIGQLLSALAEWDGLIVDEHTALSLIERLAKDMRTVREATSRRSPQGRAGR